MERILELGRELTSTVALEPLLHRIVEAAAELTTSEAAGILLLDEDAGELRFITATMMANRLADIPVPIEGSVAGAAFSSGKPLIVPNAHADPRYYSVVEQLTGFQASSLLAVPLQFQDRRIGVLEAENKLGGQEFDRQDVETLTALAAQATIAIENARLVLKLRQANERLEQEIVVRAQAEEQLREHRNRLETLVTQRTGELEETVVQLEQEIAEREKAQKRLRQYTLELEARNEELDAFAHTVAHNLKNPLGVVVGLAWALRDGYAELSDEELGDYLAKVAQSGQKMDRIVDELLLLSSVRQMEEVQIERLDMAQIVAEAQVRLSGAITKSRAEITLPQNWPGALGYGPWVEEVWVNYITNAIKYGGQPPRVELGATEQRDGMVRFWIQDDGSGILPEEQARLFVPFARLHQVRIPGHGLGLSIVQRIVTKLGGQVGVESAGVPGQGSIFFFTLPGMS